jgi:hypothetical protein
LVSERRFLLHVCGSAPPAKLVIFQPVLGFAVRVRPQTRRTAPSFPRRRRFVRFSFPATTAPPARFRAALPSFRLLAPPFFSLCSPRCCSVSLRQIRPGFAFPAARHSWGSDSFFLEARRRRTRSSRNRSAGRAFSHRRRAPLHRLRFSGTKPPGTELLFAVWIRRFAAAGPSSSPSFGYQSGLAFSVHSCRSRSRL